jgi:hypothetical protein
LESMDMTATLVLRAANSATRSENADISVGQTKVKSRLAFCVIGRWWCDVLTREEEQRRRVTVKISFGRHPKIIRKKTEDGKQHHSIASALALAPQI